MTRGHLAHVLSGRRKTIAADTLLSIAQTLSVTTDWLLTGEGPIERWVPAPELAKADVDLVPAASKLKAAGAASTPSRKSKKA